jgi:hypothetical protein
MNTSDSRHARSLRTNLGAPARRGRKKHVPCVKPICEDLESRRLLAGTPIQIFPFQYAGTANLRAFRHNVIFTATPVGQTARTFSSDGIAFHDLTSEVVNSAAVIGNSLYFANSAKWLLWKTDGTPGGNIRLLDANPLGGNKGPGTSNLTAVGTTLFFTTNDQTQPV